MSDELEGLMTELERSDDPVCTMAQVVIHFLGQDSFERVLEDIEQNGAADAYCDGLMSHLETTAFFDINKDSIVDLILGDQIPSDMPLTQRVLMGTLTGDYNNPAVKHWAVGHTLECVATLVGEMKDEVWI